jgi:FkbH-like protein
VFIDDNPAERGRVAEQLPAVLVPDWPQNPMAYGEALLRMTCFDSPAFSREDSQRTRMYQDEQLRVSAMSSVGSLEDWLRSLDLTVRVKELAAEDIDRAVQLLNKTNQMNLRTRRMTREELLAWTNEPHHRFWTFRVSDRFGDSGLTGLLSVALEERDLEIIDFVLSCRVFGRQIENVMVHEAVSHARQNGCRTVRAELVPTLKNKPCRDFWSGSGFSSNGSDNVFLWGAETEYALPSFVTIHRN